MGYLENIKAQGTAANPFFCMMGIRIIAVGEGTATIGMEVRPDMGNGEGYLQGGLYTALADEAMALAIYTQIAADHTIATISETTHFLRGVRDGELVASGTLVKKGRRVIYAEADVRAGGRDGPLVARCSAAYAVNKPNHGPDPVTSR